MDCELLIPYEHEMYVRSFMTAKEKIIKANTACSWGTAKDLDCGHFKAFVQVGDQRFQMKPCFFTEEVANTFVDKCGAIFQELLGSQGRWSTRIQLN